MPRPEPGRHDLEGGPGIGGDDHRRRELTLGYRRVVRNMPICGGGQDAAVVEMRAEPARTGREVAFSAGFRGASG
jgi:hypothetical protein